MPPSHGGGKQKKGSLQNFRVDGWRSKVCVTSVKQGSLSVLWMRKTSVTAIVETYLLVEVDHTPKVVYGR